MFDLGMYIESEIKQIIHSTYPTLDVAVFADRIAGSYFISISDEEIYHSDEYQMMILDIKMDYLWKNNISNCFFVYERKPCYNNIIESISSVKKIETKYISWNISDKAHISRPESEVYFNYDLVA